MILFEGMSNAAEEQEQRGGCNGMTDIETDLMLARARIATLEQERDEAMRRAEELEGICNAAAVTLGVDENTLHPLYICDRRKCNSCNPKCTHTDDLRHAKNFAVASEGNIIIEKERC